MSFQKSVVSLIRKYGSDVNIVRGENRVKTKAFIQPLRYRSNVYSDKNIELLGFSDGRYYLYIGEPSHVFLRKD
ncbi:MAG: hypothetical protein IKB73_06835, partial [Ruminococcus sp.]|nr:hypothetical protein [Ruminococcus sp.]